MDWKTFLVNTGVIAAKVALGVFALAVIDRIKRGMDDGDFEANIRKWL